FTGKRALVTGAGAGIGRTVALHLSKLGAEVFALSRTKSKLESLQEEDPKIKIITQDVSNWDATRKAVAEITPIHLLVNNAGSFGMSNFQSVTPEFMDEMFNVNVKAPVNISQVVINDL
ncbi:Short-chain dehydrogenase/reductase SDR, partial [Trinorchestia longiramus]